MTTLVVKATDTTGNVTTQLVNFTQGSPQPVHLHSVYYMLWRNSGSPLLSAVSRKFNQWRLAFAQTQDDGHLRLVGYGPHNLTDFKAGIQSYRARGNTVLISIGGQDGAVNTSNPTQFVLDLIAIDTLLGGVDGIDWDVEASALNQSNVLAINMGVTALRPNWIIGFVPHGGNVDQYLPVAVATVKAGMRVQYGQQFYEATVSYNDAHWRIQQAIAAGIPVKSIYIGMMNWVQGWSDAAPDHFWDVNTCVSNMQRFLAEWPALLGAAYWEAGRIARSQDSATYPDRVGTVLGLS